MTTIFVGEVVRFVEHDEIRTDFTTAAQRVEKLIAIDLGGADDQRRVGVLFPVAGQYSDRSAPNSSMNSWYFGVGERLQRRRVPGAPPALQKPPNLLARDPRLAAAGRRGDEHVFVFEHRECFELKRVGFERRGPRRADAFEESFDFPMTGNNAAVVRLDAVAADLRADFCDRRTAFRLPVFSVISAHEVILTLHLWPAKC